jgi:serine/threonine protein kinase
MTLTQGQILNNRYRIVKLLGQGGYGAVYKAWDTTLNIPCAIKEGFETAQEMQQQFLREAQILAGLRPTCRASPISLPSPGRGSIW